jgi:hypothetical protein
MTALSAPTKTVTTLKQADRYYRTPDNRIGLENRIKELAKAGALILAEIERLQRLEENVRT